MKRFITRQKYNERTGMSLNKKISLCGIAFMFLLFLSSGCAFVKRADLNSGEGRVKAVDAYLSEFCSTALKGTKIGTAIREVMMRLPSKDLKVVMDRRRPVLFTEVYDSGTARFASSSEIIVFPDDVHAFQEGMTIIKLSTALENGDRDAIMGIVAHELAHRVLDHVRLGNVSCKAEREANDLVKSWGFIREFESASDRYGRKKGGGRTSSCQEWTERTILENE